MGEDFAKQVAEHRKRRRVRLMSAAAKAFAQNGLKQITMDQVAQSAGVSKVVYYRYFGSKDKLIHSILDDIVEKFLSADESQVDWWGQVLPLTLEIARENKYAMTLLFRYAAHEPKYGSHFQRLRDVLVERSKQRQTSAMSDALNQVIEDPTEANFLSETMIAFLFDAYVRWLETDTFVDDQKFVEWLAKSVRAMNHYWVGQTPPQ